MGNLQKGAAAQFIWLNSFIINRFALFFEQLSSSTVHFTTNGRASSIKEQQRKSHFPVAYPRKDHKILLFMPASVMKLLREVHRPIIDVTGDHDNFSSHFDVSCFIVEKNAFFDHIISILHIASARLLSSHCRFLVIVISKICLTHEMVAKDPFRPGSLNYQSTSFIASL